MVPLELRLKWAREEKERQHIMENKVKLITELKEIINNHCNAVCRIETFDQAEWWGKLVDIEDDELWLGVGILTDGMASCEVISLKNIKIIERLNHRKFLYQFKSLKNE